ncbi:MAG TPA: nucleotidyltransferase family protein [Pyrinomonadaceae bacterium]|nr:nucleotidyltransferase family protein [Pyrinomonadaceae bacterium]
MNPEQALTGRLFERRENQLLIAVAHLSSVSETQIHQLIRPDLDWEYLLARAHRHGITPLLYRSLDSCQIAVPPPVMEELKVRSHEIFKSNLALTGELLKLVDFLNTNDVVAIPFKGPTLALRAYREIGLRQFKDLDVLVHKSDVARVRGLLRDRGFKPEPELSLAQQAALLRFDCACTFINEQRVALDVHWDFVERYFSFQTDTARFWGRVEQTTIGNRQVSTLSTEDLLLVLCLHGFTHLWERLVWISDIACLINSENEVDWRMVLGNATRLGCRRILALGLFLANDLLQAPLPREVSAIINADPQVGKLAARVRAQLFTEERGPAGLLAEVALLIDARERTRDKLKTCMRMAGVPRKFDWMALAVPGPLFFVYYAVRPLRLLWRYGTKLLNAADATTAPAKSAVESLKS